MAEVDKNNLTLLIRESLNYFFRKNVDGKDYPTLRKLKSTLRNNIIFPLRRNIIEAYIVGSEAKGTANENSDLDIAIIVEPVRGKTSLQLTEAYHSKFSSEQFVPRWNGRKIDVQFFYPTDEELKSYQKIKLI